MNDDDDQVGQVLNFAKVDNEVVAGVVQVLTDVLEMAMTGDIIGIAIATAHVGGHDGSGFCLGTGNIAQLNLAIDRLKDRILNYEDEGDE